jgi:hypothetical protein
LLPGDEPVVTVAACASAICSGSATFASHEVAAHYCEPALDIFKALNVEAHNGSGDTVDLCRSFSGEDYKE